MIPLALLFFCSSSITFATRPITVYCHYNSHPYYGELLDVRVQFTYQSPYFLGDDKVYLYYRINSPYVTTSSPSIYIRLTDSRPESLTFVIPSLNVEPGDKIYFKIFYYYTTSQLYNGVSVLTDYCEMYIQDIASSETAKTSSTVIVVFFSLVALSYLHYLKRKKR